MESLQCLLDSLGMGQAVYIEHEEGAADDALKEIKPMEKRLRGDYDLKKVMLATAGVPTSSYSYLKHMVDEGSTLPSLALDSSSCTRWTTTGLCRGWPRGRGGEGVLRQ